jgi:hypothetical protein
MKPKKMSRKMKARQQKKTMKAIEYGSKNDEKVVKVLTKQIQNITEKRENRMNKLASKTKKKKA